MLRFLLNISLLLCLLCKDLYGQSSNKVSLQGTFINFKNAVLLEDMSEMKELFLQSADQLIVADSLNHFTYSFSLEQPGYFRLGRNILYLSPGDSLLMTINWLRQDSSTFKGTGSEANEYLKILPFPKAGSFLEAGDSIESTLIKTVDKIEKSAQRRKNILSQVVNISENFRALENVRIKADIINSLIMINTYFAEANNLKDDSLRQYNVDYRNIIVPKIRNLTKDIGLNPQYLQLQVYRQILQSILRNATSRSMDRGVINDWIKATDLVQRFKGITVRKNINFFSDQLNQIKTKKYKDAVMTTFKSIMSFRKNDLAFDFKMLDTAGKAIALSTFKSKTIYLDLWATWCLPCLEEFEHLQKIKEKFKNNDRVVFLTLSIDSDTEKWKAFLKKRNDFDNQYIIDRSLLARYHVTELPRVILINRFFRIEAMEGDLPSSGKVIAIIDKLLDY